MQGKWEQRYHPLRQEWIIYSAHRNTRPWQGAMERGPAQSQAYDPDCYLCPGNARVLGAVNPAYTDVFVFDNDHPVVGMQAPEVSETQGIFMKKRAHGIARVVCYDPRHNVTMADLTDGQVTKVLEVWQAQVNEFHRNPEIKFVLIFENRGEIVGTSNPHPHCQIYATNFVFKHVETEMAAVNAYRKNHNTNLFDSILDAERKSKARIIYENDHAISMVPFFARYAYEVWIFPKKHCATLAGLSEAEITGLAQAYKDLVERYDRLYNMAFPYVMSIYQAPVDGGHYEDYHLHLVFLPPLRQPGIKKFPAGPEIGGGNFMADTMPEEKAQELKNAK
jgi:UDPglucose--hexose-1-phosphate uridylyltransferase